MTEHELSIDEARTLVEAIAALSRMADRVLPPVQPALVARLQAHLGGAMTVVPNTSLTLPPIEHANVQLAMNALERDATSWEVIGMQSDIGNYGGMSLPGLIAGEWHGPGETARQYVAVDIGSGEPLRCLRAGIVLTSFEGEPVAVLTYFAQRGMPELEIEVVGRSDAQVERFLDRLRALMDEHNVMRGKVMSFTFGRYGEFGMTFATVDAVTRDQVIIPAVDLDAIEQHAIGITEHRDELIAAGQHVKRGLLLYGPPGTGKTHTLSYLLNRMRGRTTVILSGAAVGAVGQAGTIARALQPATIVIEDVDLIGMDRGLPGGDHNSILFQLLNEMDGLSGDADVLFVLTTNRVDMLEPALSARPGRIDQAIEIALPDADARRRLLALYLPGPVDDDVAERVVAGTDGVAAAFIKELARRTALATFQTGTSTSECIETCLTALVEQSSPILRRSLAAEAEPVDGVFPGAVGMGPGPQPGGWAHVPWSG
jgi:cell division protease FtsH